MLRWRVVWLALAVLLTWAGCSGRSQRNRGSELLAGRGGESGQSGAAVHGGSGNQPEGGAAGQSDGGSSALQSGGTSAFAGRGGSGALAGRGGTSGSSGSSGSGGSAGASSGGVSVGGGGGTGGSTAVPIEWGCSRSAYGDGKCDCGCLSMDPDCTEEDLKHCDVCNGFGSCNRAECPGRIDPDDITHCLAPPEGWTCSDAAYGDGTTCDCGCGIADVDCPDTDPASCDSCQTPGSCAHGPCPSAVAPDDNTRCEIPARWQCDPYTYGDGLCHCGCGSKDVDCPDSSVDSCDSCLAGSCSSSSCAAIDPAHNEFCTVPPPNWTCQARLYHDGSQCDCGCGVFDPDCESRGIDACAKCNASGSCSAQPCPGLIRADRNELCARPPAPPEWTCPADYYGGDGYCDCGCGAPDPDCRTTDLGSCQDCPGCGSRDCMNQVDPTDTTQCKPPPSGWLCSDAEYFDIGCDCGCGILDPACYGEELVSACDNYPEDGCSGGHGSHVDPMHNAVCTVTIPAGWTCDRHYYADGLCDCGCGAADLDCASSQATDCAACDDPGSCSASPCDSAPILADDNAHCSG